jgi:hypothetical protein
VSTAHRQRLSARRVALPRSSQLILHRTSDLNTSPPSKVYQATSFGALCRTTTGATTTADVPAGAVSGTPSLIHTPDVVVMEDHPGGFRLGGMTSDLQVCKDGDCVDDYVSTRPVTVTLTYQDADVAGLIEEELYLLTWDGSEWTDAVADCG